MRLHIILVIIFSPSSDGLFFSSLWNTKDKIVKYDTSIEGNLTAITEDDDGDTKTHYRLPTITLPLPHQLEDLSSIQPSPLVSKKTSRMTQTTTDSSMEEPSSMDRYLLEHFPGYFHNIVEIHDIDDAMQGRRHRRRTDGDICCKTTLWFGPAPKALMDVNDEGPWKILQGDTVYQAYSRGDCHNTDKKLPKCPDGGICRQKKRLHTLWVDVEGVATLKYFKINSHCVYEKIQRSRATARKTKYTSQDDSASTKAKPRQTYGY